MGFLELLLIAAGLSMDAFAVSLCKGLGTKKLNIRSVGIIALFFGGFQALMPLLGWFLGKQFEPYITDTDHWIAFILLAFIGGKMIIESIKEEEACCPHESDIRIKELLLLAVATSIDALAVGVTFAFLAVSILPAITVIGCTTFIISAAGVAIGHRFGARFRKQAEIAGGIILILIGVKILISHLGM